MLIMVAVSGNPNLKDNSEILIITDAWKPQTNGVARTLAETSRTLRQQGDKVHIVHPGLFKSFKKEPYPKVKLTKPQRKLFNFLDQFIKKRKPDCVHIATPEGPLGLMSKFFMDKNRVPYTTAYHTDIPAFIKKARYISGLSEGSRLYENFIHRNSCAVMATTPSMADRLTNQGFENVKVWGRGVNLKDFSLLEDSARTKLRKKLGIENKEGPFWLNVGRVSAEKNLEEFLNLDLPGTKIIVGDGPQLGELQERYKGQVSQGKIIFTGEKRGDKLQEWYSAADIFVFPSKFDTFGLVNLEALASGLLVAAYDVTGPKDIFSIQDQDDKVGFLNDDLKEACNEALQHFQSDKMDRLKSRDFVAKNYTWDTATKRFRSLLVPINETSKPKSKSDFFEVLRLEHPDNTRKVRALSFSDIHTSTINNGDLPARDHTQKFVSELEKINLTVANSDKKNRHDILILNGDILDLLESYIWEYGKLATNGYGIVKDQEKLIELFNKIVDSQPRLFQAFRSFLENSTDSEIVYLPGNHDHLMKTNPLLRELFIQAVVADNQSLRSRIRFADELEIPSLGLHVEHGHRIDAYDYSENGEPNYGDYLSLIKVNVVKNIFNRLDDLKNKYSSDRERKILDKYKSRVLKVEYIRDAQFFPLYLQLLAKKAKEKLGDLGKDIHEAIMHLPRDSAKFLRKTPFLGKLGFVLPEKVLGSGLMMQFFIKVINHVYKELTHKNSLQLDEAVKIAKRKPGFVCVSMGHTHKSGQPSRLIENKDGKDQRVVLVNTGTYIPTKFGEKYKGKIEFERVLQPKGGVIFKADLDPNKTKQRVLIRPISGDDSEYKFMKKA